MSTDHTETPAEPPFSEPTGEHSPRSAASAALRAVLRRPAPIDAVCDDGMEIDDGYDGDAPSDPDVDVQRSGPGHYVMDRAAIAKALRVQGFDGTYDHLSSGEEQRVRTLVAYRDQTLWRPHLVGTPAMTARLDRLGQEQPNFTAVVRFVRRAVHLSQVSGTPIRVSPIILVGSPGCGKSRFAKTLADALGTSCDIINGASIPDVGSITGYPPAWRGAGPGRIAKYLMTSPTSGPLIFVDEAEKIVDYERMTYPLDKILALLEHDTAASYQDENLQVPMRAQNAIFVFACNTLDGLSLPLRDRMVVFSIPDLNPDQRDAVLEAMLREIAEAMGLHVSLASRAALAPLRSLGLRRCRLAFEIAVALAVDQERRFLIAADLGEAARLLGDPDRKGPVGFIRYA